MTFTKKHKHLLVGYGLVAGVYFLQARRLALNPSLGTALQWPLWLLKAPRETIGVLLGSGTVTTGNI